MIFNIIQIVISVILIIIILLQHRGSGLGAAFGGQSNIYQTKRGLEKTLHYLTIFFILAFFITSILNVIY